MDNILYLDDYINLYNKKNKQLLVIKPYKNTFKNGLIINRDKFIKKMNNIKEKYMLKEKLFDENIYVISNNLYNKEDKNLINSILEELNYKNIKFINELNYLKINKDIIYINFNYSYFYFLYTDFLGNTKISIYENNVFNKNIIVPIINEMKKKIVIIYGKNNKELINIIDKTNINYYVFESSDNLIINYMVNDKKM